MTDRSVPDVAGRDVVRMSSRAWLARFSNVPRRGPLVQVGAETLQTVRREWDAHIATADKLAEAVEELADDLRGAPPANQSMAVAVRHRLLSALKTYHEEMLSNGT